MNSSLRSIALVCLALILSACASKEKSPDKKVVEVEAASASEDNSNSMAKIEKAQAIRVNYNPNELITRVSEFIAQKPESSLEDVVKYANKMLGDIGLPFSLIVPSAEIIGAETIISTEDGKRLNVGLGSEPLCAPGIVVTYPAQSRSKGIWTVKYKSGTYQIKGAPLREGTIFRAKDNKAETKIGLPEEGPEPGGITSSGASVLVRFDLTPAASSWWQRVMRRDSREEQPFLVLEMGANDFEFSDDEDFYDNFDYNPKKIELENDQYQLKFEDSKYYYQGLSCG